jgi:predicted transcriptional regulator of viral defense system
MSAGKNQIYGGSGLRLLESLFADSKFVFSFDDAQQAAQLLTIPVTSVPRALASMVHSGWIQRLRRGLYIGTPELPGFAQVPSFAIATSLVTPSAISHWSALSFHGLTEQLPRDVFATTTKKVVTPSMRRPQTRSERLKHAWNIGGMDYRYVTVRSRFFFGWELVWLDERFRVPIFTRERALLDLFASPRSFGGIGEGLEILERHLGEIQIQRLVDDALQYGVVSACKRLGWALQAAGASDRQTIRLRRIPAAGFSLLDPGSPACGLYDKRWNVQVNLPGKQS